MVVTAGPDPEARRPVLAAPRPGGAALLLPGGAALLLPGGAALLLPGGAALLLPGGAALLPGGAALLLPGGAALLLPGGAALLLPGGVAPARDGVLRGQPGLGACETKGKNTQGAHQGKFPSWSRTERYPA